AMLVHGVSLSLRFWQARHPPRYAAYLIPSSPSFPHSSANAFPLGKKAPSYQSDMCELDRASRCHMVNPREVWRDTLYALLAVCVHRPGHRLILIEVLLRCVPEG
ncbi:hypothetical protein, partial [Bradyrhizobium liaoningense]|uniref:hypothetical protein n=1 Tax=Bradyrhizobium liaoningense TaxID=43992 RepID=UPI0024E18BF7